MKWACDSLDFQVQILRILKSVNKENINLQSFLDRQFQEFSNDEINNSLKCLKFLSDKKYIIMNYSEELILYESSIGIKRQLPNEIIAKITNEGIGYLSEIEKFSHDTGLSYFLALGKPTETSTFNMTHIDKSKNISVGGDITNSSLDQSDDSSSSNKKKTIAKTIVIKPKKNIMKTILYWLTVGASIATIITALRYFEYI